MSDQQKIELNDKPERAIVLLDEIDKAPRDVPNDILNEIESLEFMVPELELTDPIRIEEQENPYRPVVIITSNSERDLPEAFLRRCVYYHIEFPPFVSDGDDEISVESIVMSRLGDRYSGSDKLIREGLDLVEVLRDEVSDLNKAPGIAEILNWFDYLDKLRNRPPYLQEKVDSLNRLQRDDLMNSVKNTLLKTSEDQKRAEELLTSYMGKK